MDESRLHVRDGHAMELFQHHSISSNADSQAEEADPWGCEVSPEIARAERTSGHAKCQGVAAPRSRSPMLPRMGDAGSDAAYARLALVAASASASASLDVVRIPSVMRDASCQASDVPFARLAVVSSSAADLAAGPAHEAAQIPSTMRDVSCQTCFGGDGRRRHGLSPEPLTLSMAVAVAGTSSRDAEAVADDAACGTGWRRQRPQSAFTGGASMLMSGAAGQAARSRARLDPSDRMASNAEIQSLRVAGGPSAGPSAARRCSASSGVVTTRMSLDRPFSATSLPGLESHQRIRPTAEAAVVAPPPSYLSHDSAHPARTIARVESAPGLVSKAHRRPISAIAR
jgi:hypothetical protein